MPDKCCHNCNFLFRYKYPKVSQGSESSRELDTVLGSVPELSITPYTSAISIESDRVSEIECEWRTNSVAMLCSIKSK